MHARGVRSAMKGGDGDEERGDIDTPSPFEVDLCLNVHLRQKRLEILYRCWMSMTEQ